MADISSSFINRRILLSLTACPCSKSFARIFLAPNRVPLFRIWYKSVASELRLRFEVAFSSQSAMRNYNKSPDWLVKRDRAHECCIHLCADKLRKVEQPVVSSGSMRRFFKYYFPYEVDLILAVADIVHVEFVRDRRRYVLFFIRTGCFGQFRISRIWILRYCRTRIVRWPLAWMILSNGVTWVVPPENVFQYSITYRCQYVMNGKYRG